MISRIIFISVLLAVGYLLLRSWQRKKFIKKQAQELATTTQTTPKRMVRCDYCSLHIPEHEAIADGGQFYCCLEHARHLKNPH